jgi:hypothetical protein
LRARHASSYYFHPADFRAGWRHTSAPDQKISLFELIILVLTIYWLLSFFGQSIIPGLRHTGGFIDMLSVIIVVLIIMKFLL